MLQDGKNIPHENENIPKLKEKSYARIFIVALLIIFFNEKKSGGVPGGPLVKNLPCSAGNTGLGRYYMPQSS